MRIRLTWCSVLALMVSLGSPGAEPAKPRGIQNDSPALSSIGQHSAPESPWATGGILVTEGMKGRLLLIDRATKQVVWESSTLRGAFCVASLPTGELVVGEGRSVALIDKNGRLASRSPASFQLTTDVKPVEGGRLLVSDGAAGTVAEMDWKGSIVWSVSRLHWPSESVRLENGNTVVADGTSLLKEFDSRGELVRATRLKRWAAAVQRLSNGNTLVGESGVVELLDDAGKTIWSRKRFKRVTSVQGLPNDEIMICEPDAGRVVVLDAGGNITWEAAGLGLPGHAVYLR